MSNHTPERAVSVAELRTRTGLSTSTIYQMMADQLLNRPGKVSPGRVGWPASYIDNWLSARLSSASYSPSTSAAA